MPTLSELLCELSGLPSGTLGEHLCAARDRVGNGGPGETVFVPIVVEGLAGVLIEEEEALATMTEEQELAGTMVEEEEAPAATVEDIEDIAGTLIDIEDMTGVLED